MTNKFKVGDRVRCCNPPGGTSFKPMVNQTGTVKEDNGAYVYVEWDDPAIDKRFGGGYLPERFEKLSEEFKVGDKVKFRDSTTGAVYTVLTDEFEYNDIKYVVLDAPTTGNPRVVRTNFLVKHVEKWKVGEFWKLKQGADLKYQIIHVEEDFAVVMRQGDKFVTKFYDQNKYVRVS